MQAIGRDCIDARDRTFDDDVGVVPHDVGVVAGAADQRDIGRSSGKLIVSASAVNSASGLVGLAPGRWRA